MPFPGVDHTHPDSIIALATMKNGKDVIKKVYNNKIGWLDWQRPGFDLGLKMEKLIKKNKNIIGIVLGHHGLFTWGDTSEECYKNSIDIIKKAQVYLNNSIKKYSFGKPIFKKKTNPEFEKKLISILRGNLSFDNSKILHLDKSETCLEFVNSENLKIFFDQTKHKMLELNGIHLECARHIQEFVEVFAKEYDFTDIKNVLMYINLFRGS